MKLVVGLAAWVGAGVLAAVVLSLLKRRDRRILGRDILRQRGMPDYRYSCGVHKGRWASEVLVDDLDDADDERRARGG